MNRKFQKTGISVNTKIDPNTEVGTKLRALYTSIQEEGIPRRFLDLLEKMDTAEKNPAKMKMRGNIKDE